MRTRSRRLLVEDRARDQVRGARPRLETAFGDFALAVGDVGAARGQLQAAENTDRACSRTRCLQRALVAPDQPDVPDFAQVPLLRDLLAAVVVHVQVVAIHEGQRDRQAPAALERPAVAGHHVLVARAHLVMVMRDLADSHVARAGRGWSWRMFS